MFDQVTLRSSVLSHLVHAGPPPPALPVAAAPTRAFCLRHDSAIATAFHFLPVLTSISVNDALHTFHYYNDEELILNIGGTRRAWN